MYHLAHKQVLVLGLGSSGLAAADLLLCRGAQVTLMDQEDTETMRSRVQPLMARGATIELGAVAPPAEPFDLVVVSPGVPCAGPWVREMRQRRVPVIGELELGYQQSRCLPIAITGTNGKTTTTELIERMLTCAQRRTKAAGNIGRPICSVVDQTRQLDYLTLEVSSFQLETILYFRPVIGVLLNVTADHLDRYPSLADYARAKARLFMNQQPFDWAVVQSEAMAYLRTLGLEVPSKLITFSSLNRRADLYLDRGLIISRLPDWSGPLLDLDHCQLAGPHNAENVMAALAVGRILRVPLKEMVSALKAYPPAAHRCELVSVTGGVRFINDSKATNLDALQKALMSVPAGRGGEPNVWLIAGGKNKGLEYHEIGPLLARRVKGVFLIGEMREQLRAAWSLFTPCALADSLLEAVNNAARKAVAGDVVLFSPACSSFDMFQNYQHRGDVFRQAVEDWAGSRSADANANPNTNPKTNTNTNTNTNGNPATPESNSNSPRAGKGPENRVASGESLSTLDANPSRTKTE